MGALRVGLYAWGGPGTIDLLKTKYHRPKIDEKSFYTLYTKKYIEHAQEKLGLTDMWLTYSWGFGDEREQEQYAYIKEVLPTIRDTGVRTYAYIQGFNVVHNDFKDADFYCRSISGKRIPYSKGRFLICPSHPDTLVHLQKRVAAALALPFDGIYIDNIIFGLMPFIVGENFSSTFGCHCTYCAKEFKNRFQYDIPSRAHSRSELNDLLAFRTHQVTKVVRELSKMTREKEKVFGVNLFDPVLYTPELYFGYSFKELQSLLDYYLIENHAISTTLNELENKHIAELVREGKPTFVLSYKYGIGCEPMFSQETMNRIYEDADSLGYSPCVKGSEFTTNGVWHTFDIDAVDTVNYTNNKRDRTSSRSELVKQSLPNHGLPVRTAWRLVDRFIPTLYTWLYHSRILWSLFVWTGLYTYTLRKERRYNL